MLATRIIPTLLTRGRQLVKGVAFESWRSVGVTPQACRIHSMRGVDELVLLDIDATRKGCGPDFALVEELSSTMFMPLAVGGGIRSLGQVTDLLRAGADKVVVCTAALDDPELISRISDRVGRQVLTVAIDYRYMRNPLTNDVIPVVCSHAGTMACYRQQEPLTPAKWARLAEQLGAGEILLTNIEREGQMQGYDLPLLKEIAEALEIPVIANAGCGTYEHMGEAIRHGANGVAAGSMFLFTDQTPHGAAEYLQGQGIETRLK